MTVLRKNNKIARHGFVVAKTPFLMIKLKFWFLNKFKKKKGKRMEKTGEPNTMQQQAENKLSFFVVVVCENENE